MTKLMHYKGSNKCVLIIIFVMSLCFGAYSQVDMEENDKKQVHVLTNIRIGATGIAHYAWSYYYLGQIENETYWLDSDIYDLKGNAGKVYIESNLTKFIATSLGLGYARVKEDISLNRYFTGDRIESNIARYKTINDALIVPYRIWIEVGNWVKFYGGIGATFTTVLNQNIEGKLDYVRNDINGTNYEAGRLYDNEISAPGKKTKFIYELFLGNMVRFNNSRLITGFVIVFDYDYITYTNSVFGGLEISYNWNINKKRKDNTL